MAADRIARGLVCRLPSRARAAREPKVEALERRWLLASSAPTLAPVVSPNNGELVFQNVFPPSRMIGQPGTFLSTPSRGAPPTLARAFVASHASDLGLTPAEVASSQITDQYTDDLTGVTHLYLQQLYRGLPVVNATLSISIMPDGRLLSVGGGFVPGLGKLDATRPTPLISAGLALNVASGQLNLAKSSAALSLSASRPARGAQRLTTLTAPNISNQLIPAKLVYVPVTHGVELAWDCQIQTADHQHWYDVAVGDQSGQIVFADDWVEHASYNALPLPEKSPDDGPTAPNRSIVTDPADPLASPYGWHDTDGVPGAEFTDTRGNNVLVQEDADQNNSGGFRPDGGAALNFDFPLDLTQAPIAYQSAAITNVFYWTNLLHDIHYKYGFTEVAGNFQANNYGRGGYPYPDPVTVDTEDGSDTNNSSFACPPDGNPPRMTMYLFTATSPRRDSALDDEIIIHEYGHGVSLRLTGGPGTTTSLTAIQSKGMGEGWSDWWSLMFTLKPGDLQMGAYPIGNYVLGQPGNGPGIRRVPYSYDMSIDPLTIDAFASGGMSGSIPRSIEPHNTGEIWCSALWDMSWLLMNKYGFSPDIQNGYDPATGNDKGNQLALRLVMDALKIQPGNPSFLQARNAILQADLALTGGKNQAEIWTAFARRGMGEDFVDESGFDAAVLPGFALPILDPHVISTSLPAAGYITTPIGSIDFNFDEPIDAASFSIADDVIRFTGPGYVDLKPQITGYSWLTSSKLRISFAPTAQLGEYVMTLGPDILAFDDAEPMDQNLNRIPGEGAADSFTASVSYLDLLGPEGFGYKAAPYAFENIDLVPGTPGVTSILDNVNDSYENVDLGANRFNFFGSQFTGANQLFVSSNGLVTFFQGSSAAVNGSLLSNPNPKTIAVYWDDWMTNVNSDPNAADNDVVLYRLDDTTGDSIPDRLIIEWSNVYEAAAPLSPVTFQLILQLNTSGAGRMIFNYPDLDAGDPAFNDGAAQTEGIKEQGLAFSTNLVIGADTAHPWVGSGRAIQISTDVEPPFVLMRDYQDRITPELNFHFSEDVGPSLSPADLVLENLTDGVTLSATNLAMDYDTSTRTATVRFPGYPAGVLPDGNYRVTLKSRSITDPSGNALDGNADTNGANHMFDFFVLGADANHDRIVDIRDLSVIGLHWHQTGTDFSQGDFNYDGVVDARDLGILSRNWQKTLAAP